MTDERHPPQTSTIEPQSSRQNLPPWQGWLPILAFPVLIVLLAPADLPRWVFMWLLAFGLYVGCKWLTWRRRTVLHAPIGRHLAYLFAWPGLEVDAFLDPTPIANEQRPSLREWAFASAKFGLGLGLFFIVPGYFPQRWDLLVGWIGMFGIIFSLHFGLFHLLSCFWRSVGIRAKPLMNWPIRSTSLSEFWGRRWNTAFRDLTHRFLFRPLTAKLGARWALFVGFVFSGLIHDLVITIPAGGGYGGPTVFFLIQGVAMFLERSRWGKSVGLCKGWPGWFFTLSLLIVPIALLFSPVFVRNIILPFMADLGTISTAPLS